MMDDNDSVSLLAVSLDYGDRENVTTETPPIDGSVTMSMYNVSDSLIKLQQSMQLSTSDSDNVTISAARARDQSVWTSSKEYQRLESLIEEVDAAGRYCKEQKTLLDNLKLDKANLTSRITQLENTVGQLEKELSFVKTDIKKYFESQVHGTTPAANIEPTEETRAVVTNAMSSEADKTRHHNIETSHEHIRPFHNIARNFPCNIKRRGTVPDRSLARLYERRDAQTQRSIAILSRTIMEQERINQLQAQTLLHLERKLSRYTTLQELRLDDQRLVTESGISSQAVSYNLREVERRVTRQQQTMIQKLAYLTGDVDGMQSTIETMRTMISMLKQKSDT